MVEFQDPTVLDNVFFTADQHFCHTNIIDYCDRPFQDVATMNREMVDRWNDTVGPDDYVFQLGDFCLGGISTARQYLAKLNGRISVLPGNHDQWHGHLHDRESVTCSAQNWTVRATPPLITVNYPTLSSVHGFMIVMCHYAMCAWPRSHLNHQQDVVASIHLFGHSHGRFQHPQPFTLDVGVDAQNFTPVSLRQVLTQMNVDFS